MGGLNLVMDGQGQMRVSEVDALSARCFDIVLCARLSTSNCYLPQSPHLWNRDDLRPYLLRIAGDVRERMSKKHLGGSQPTAMAQGRVCCFLTQKAPAPCSAGPFLFCEWLSWWKIISVCVQGGSAPGQAGGRMARAGGHGGWSGLATPPPSPPRSHTPDTEQAFPGRGALGRAFRHSSLSRTHFRGSFMDLDTVAESHMLVATS